MRLYACILLFSSLMCHGAILAQKEDHGFYARMGKTDGLYEQTLKFDNEQDELDYWNDQRSFERSLYREKPLSYRLYLQAKRAVYTTHRSLCAKECGHGDYYWLQSSYYAQFGPEALPEYSLSEKGREPGAETLKY